MADRIMTLTMQVFTSPGAVAHEEAFMAVGHLADKLEGNFQKYLAHFMPALMTGLKSVEEYEVCTCAIGVVGDLCRAVQHEMTPYCDDIVHHLLVLLQSQSLNRVVKPHVIAVFADVSLAIEGSFDRYAGTVLHMLEQAGEVSISTDDEDIIEYINQLREAILDAYIGIVQGQQADPKRGMNVVGPHVDKMLEFVKRVSLDVHRTSGVLKNVIALLGDLGTLFGKKLAGILREPFVAHLIQQASEDEDMTKIVDWTKQIISKLA
ncbi:KPNB1 [Symbiodinium microadriaticum]|nr:KPNB1 [Symbiodinium microadriaticum]